MEQAKTSNLQNKSDQNNTANATENDFKSSLFLEEKEDDEEETYMTSIDEKAIFITKLAVVFIIYSTVYLLAALYIIKKPDSALNVYINNRLQFTFYIYLAISLIAKMVFTFLGFFLRKLATLVFLIDLYLSFLVVIGFYYNVNGTLSNTYVMKGVYILLGCFIFFASSVAFFVASLLPAPTDIYNFKIGIILMALSSVSVFFLFPVIQPEIQIGNSYYYTAFFVSLLYQIYWNLNAYFVIHKRTKKFYKFEFVYCFLCFWADWISRFWVDLISKDEKPEQQARHQHQRNQNLDNKKNVQNIPDILENPDLENK